MKARRLYLVMLFFALGFPKAQAAVQSFTDKAAFLAATQATSATGSLPNLEQVASGGTGNATAGSLTFGLAAGGDGLAIGPLNTPAAPDWYGPLPGNDIALGYENLRIDTAPVGGMKGAADLPSRDTGDGLATGIITDRLNRNQLKIWRAIEQIALARDQAGNPFRPVFCELYNWAKTSDLRICIEMTEAEARVGGRCLYEDRVDPTSRRPAVTIRLWVSVIDRVRGVRMPGDRDFVPFEGLTAEERYCETIAHELAHVRQSVTDPEFFRLVDRQKSLKKDILRLLPRQRPKGLFT